jgi:hypothetical protein
MSKSNTLFQYFKKVDTPDKKPAIKEENKENQVSNLIQQKDDSDDVGVKSSKKSLFES